MHYLVHLRGVHTCTCANYGLFAGKRAGSEDKVRWSGFWEVAHHMHSQYGFLLASLKHPGEWLTCTTISNLSWTKPTSLRWTNSCLPHTSTRPTPPALSVAISSGCHDNIFCDVTLTDNGSMIHDSRPTFWVWNVVPSWLRNGWQGDCRTIGTISMAGPIFAVWCLKNKQMQYQRS